MRTCSSCKCCLTISMVLIAALGLSTTTAEPSAGEKSCSTFYGAEARANAAENAAKYDWARQQVSNAIAAAKPWVETSNDELWRMIVPPKLKRAIMVNVNKGCPNCGMAMYGERGPRPYAWLAWVPEHPWKVQCPNCKELFPKNDFGAFYESGIDPETALFDPNRRLDMAPKSIVHDEVAPRRLVRRLPVEDARQNADAAIGVDYVVAHQMARTVQADADAVVVDAIALDQLPRPVSDRNPVVSVVMQMVVADDPVGHFGVNAVDVFKEIAVFDNVITGRGGRV